MNELTPSPLQRPMDRAAMSNDMGILKQLLGLLNNPALTGAEVPATEVVRETTTPEPVKPMNTSTFKINTRKLFFTGASKAGKSYLAAQLGARWFELDDPIRAIAADVFGPDAREADLIPFIQEVFAWGEGLVNKQYPLTAARGLFIGNARESNAKVFGIPTMGFGKARFWLDSLAARTSQFAKDNPKELIAVTDVGTADQYKFLRGAGFTPIHVMCNNITRSGRGGSNIVDALVSSIERDITQKISQSPNGSKLWVVWSDPSYPPPSSRFLTVQEFVDGTK